MTTHRDWLTRWAERWVLNATEEIRRRQNEIVELRQALTGAADDEQRDWFESLIDQHQGIIETIRLSHGQWQRCAKRRWQFDMPELPE